MRYGLNFWGVPRQGLILGLHLASSIISIPWGRFDRDTCDYIWADLCLLGQNIFGSVRLGWNFALFMLETLFMLKFYEKKHCSGRKKQAENTPFTRLDQTLLHLLISFSWSLRRSHDGDIREREIFRTVVILLVLTWTPWIIYFGKYYSAPPF